VKLFLGVLLKFVKGEIILRMMINGSNALNSVILPSPLQYECKTSGKGANKMDKPTIKKTKKTEIDISKITVSHKMADGTIRNTVEDYEVPYNEATVIMYDLIARKVHNQEN